MHLTDTTIEADLGSLGRVDLHLNPSGRQKGYGESAGPGGVGARIRGFSFAHGRTLSFQVNKNHARSRAIFTAEIRERHDNVLIDRTVKGDAPANAFRFDPDLKTARLSPPAPFSGSATLTT